MTPGETRRQELAREYESVPSAQAFIAVCDRLIAADRERDEALADKEIARLAREFVVKLDKWLAPREDATYDEAKAAERALVIACRARATPVSAPQAGPVRGYGICDCPDRNTCREHCFYANKKPATPVSGEPKP